MNWWGWVIAGAIMLGAELGFVDAQFYLVFVGSAAMLVGLATLLDPALAPWVQWALFALLALVSMVAFRRRIYLRLRGSAPVVAHGPLRGEIIVPVALPPKASCQVEHGGTYWTVRNDGNRTLAAGERARIDVVEGLTLLVHPNP